MPSLLSRLYPLAVVAGSLVSACFSANAATVSITCGGTSDGAAINTAIAGSSPGDTIQFHGTCVTNVTITLLGKRNYYGDHRNVTTIRQAAGANLSALLASDSWVNNYAVSGDPIRIAHLNLDGNSAQNAGTNVLVIRSWLSHIEDIIVQNAPGDGIQVTSLSSNGSILSNTQVNGVIDKVWVKSSGANGIDVVDSGSWVTDWFLLDSAVEASGGSAIYLQNAAGWLIRGNHVYGVGEHGIYAGRCYGTTVEGNYIEQFGSTGASGTTYYGVYASLQGSAASTVNGNKIFMFGGTGNSANLDYIGVKGNYGVTQATVSGNTILGHSGNTEVGLNYQLGAATSLYVASTGNSIQKVHTISTIGTGVRVDTGQ
jgi:parallel beta-helix repeat protein